MTCMIAMSLIQALMYENLHEKSTMMRLSFEEITWLRGKSIGSYLGGTRFKTLLTHKFRSSLRLFSSVCVMCAHHMCTCFIQHANIRV